MKIKRFFAKDMRSALTQVKEALGSDAVIMSNKKVAGGIEIVAAIEHQSASKSPVSGEARATESAVNGRSLASDSVSISSAHRSDDVAVAPSLDTNLRFSQSPISKNTPDKQALSDGLNSIMKRQKEMLRKNVEHKKPAPEGRIHSANSFLNQSKPQNNSSFQGRKPMEPSSSVSLDSMQKQIDGIKKLLEHQVSGLMWQEIERREPIRAMLIKRLTRLGFGEELSDQLACFIPEEFSSEQAWLHLQELLTDQLNTGGDEILNHGGVVALVGPTGVGKTTTVAKLAAQAVARFGAHQVALVSTDTYRIGAHEQLSTYARIMGCSVKVAQDEQELSEILFQLRDKKLVLIDTAGMSQRDIRLQEQLDGLMSSAQVKIKSFLVLSATAQRMVIEETFEQFKRISLAGTILTKIDEALSLGEVLNVLIRQSLPVTYITNGQRVPEDIEVANAASLVNFALNQTDDKSSQHFWVSDEQEQGMSDFYE